ncbi:MAG: DinB family protein [Fimbriimonadaceae bacterium]
MTHEFLVARFAFVRQDLNEVLGRLTDADLRWAPADGMPTVAELLLEIANKEPEAIAWLQTGTWPESEVGAFDPRTATLADIKTTFVALRVATLAYIGSLSEDGLNVLVHSPERWWEASRLTDCPRSEVLRNVAAHEWYHTGQLVTYLWLRGDNPNRW